MKPYLMKLLLLVAILFWSLASYGCAAYYPSGYYENSDGYYYGTPGYYYFYGHGENFNHDGRYGRSDRHHEFQDEHDD
jgi:hypothetical protein